LLANTLLYYILIVILLLYLASQPTSQYHKSTGEFRLIRGVTGETVSVPLVRVTLQSSLCSGRFLSGLATSLPSGIDMLLENDLCPGAPAVDVAVVTRFQTASLRREADLQTPLDSEPEI